jgi:hypothetical protein
MPIQTAKVCVKTKTAAVRQPHAGEEAAAWIARRKPIPLRKLRRARLAPETEGEGNVSNDAPKKLAYT